MKQLRYSIKILITFLAVGSLITSCRQENKKLPEDFELATAWADMTNLHYKDDAGQLTNFCFPLFRIYRSYDV